ncbi:plasmid partitioning protein RepB C-terminal domain-containing protein [Novosphingobium guangzhouense]|uniref:Chromosome partitioning protein ParB n=1 Tax=Novosphingobium guangzhouense TaxID=1850347 RepID=A0A2K2FUA2_9SPHN|nr:plasmid partitioning protein RepB C-terminal domain-containing protein [Novosphingobium guangzhouense]PNU02369.1 chromosome partitioning protein ParB [Novosphingobium guangzhouense]
MTSAKPAQRIEWIPIDRITVVNPRVRNQRVFLEIVENIATIGLKRPITVTRRIESDGPFYDLVCGQGRLEAYQHLGQREVPALVVGADAEDCMIASLVENCARRQHRTIDLLQDIGGMAQRGYSHQEIARKTGLSYDYVHGVARLMDQGEQRLLRAVEARTIPLSVAVDIAESDDQGVQRALHTAYEKGELKGKKLIAARRLIDERRHRGKRLKVSTQKSSRLSTASLLKAYREDVERKRALIRRANGAHDRLMLIVEALHRLRMDDTFTGLLEDEALGTMPEAIADRLARRGQPYHA